MSSQLLTPLRPTATTLGLGKRHHGARKQEGIADMSMGMRRNLAGKFLTVSALAAALTGGAVVADLTATASATTAGGCAKVQGDDPGGNTYTIHLAEDPCGNAVRAATYGSCAFPNPQFGGDPATWKGWSYGKPIVKVGTTSATDGGFFCPTSSIWGYQEKVGGKWIWHKLGSRDGK